MNKEGNKKTVNKANKKTSKNRDRRVFKKVRIGVGVLLFIGLALLIDTTFSDSRMKEQNELNEKRYETVSEYLGVKEENVIITLTDKLNVYDVQTEKGNYKVVFSSDFTKIKHIVSKD